MADKFSHTICKTVVEEICALLGFHAIKNSSSDVLADVVRSFVTKIGDTSVKICQHSGRNEPNFYDVSLCLKREMNLEMRELYQFYQSLASSHGSGKSNASSRESTELDLSVFDFDVPEFPKPAVSNLVTSVNEREQNMQTLFSYSMKEKDSESNENSSTSGVPPALPNGTGTSNTTGAQQDAANPENAQKPSDDDRDGEHDLVPERILINYPFLPPLPPKHTFSFTPVYNRKADNSLTLQQVRTKQIRMVQTSLTRIHTADLNLNPENGDNAPEQSTALLYNMIPDLTERPPEAKNEEEDRIHTQKTGKVVNPYLVVVKQRNAQPVAERTRLARELGVNDVSSEEWGLSDTQYEQISQQRRNEQQAANAVVDDNNKKKKKRRRSDRQSGNENDVSYILRKPIVTTGAQGIDQMMPPAKKARTSLSTQQQSSSEINNK
jgi:histone H3/H4